MGQKQLVLILTKFLFFINFCLFELLKKLNMDIAVKMDRFQILQNVLSGNYTLGAFLFEKNKKRRKKVKAIFKMYNP